MAILGMRGTGSWSSDERPTNFREKILYLYPNSPAILTAITGKLKSEAVNDPKFTIFEKGLPPQRARITSTGTGATIELSDIAEGGASDTPNNIFRVGHVAMVERTQEVVWITAIDAGGENLTVLRGNSVGSTTAATVAGDYLLIIGNHNAEGASTPMAQSVNPDTISNYTQIFRTAMSLTGTAKETYLRTGEVEKELKREAAERHAIEMEWAFIFGQPHQGTNGDGYYDRTTGGVLSFLTGSDANSLDFDGAVTKDAWEGFLEDLFTVPTGSSEKLCLCGNRALTTLNAMAQAYGQIQLTPTSESYGMKFMRYETPYGTLQLKGHPLLSQNPTFASWGFIIDPKNVVYRPLKNRDTKFLTDRQDNGADAIVHEFLTECGLELRHVPTHGVFMNASAFTP